MIHQPTVQESHIQSRVSTRNVIIKLLKSTIENLKRTHGGKDISRRALKAMQADMSTETVEAHSSKLRNRKTFLDR